jgi:hypothetical protein
MSGAASASHRNRTGSLPLTPLTLKVATFIAFRFSMISRGRRCSSLPYPTRMKLSAIRGAFARAATSSKTAATTWRSIG